MVGVADSYVLSDGKLCYVHEDMALRWLRILDLHNPAGLETVIDIPRLTAEAVPSSKNCQDYSFRVIHNAEGITSCLYSFTSPEPEDWLLILDTEKHELVGAILLESTTRLFVRNSGSYLYYGTHSEYGADGFQKWVLRFFDLTKRHLSRRKIHLSNLVGYEIGSTVCFEIIDGYLYGLSNQTAFEIEEIDWTSYYYCFRFRLDDPDPHKTQIMKKRDSWRRQHAEGPLDDRWGFLKLEKDETTGQVRIIESRKEWLAGQSGNRRSYYTTKVVFRDEGEGTADEEPDDNTENNLPDDPLTMLLESSSNPNYMRPPPRLPVHAGDDGTIFGLSKTHLRSYHYSSGTFLDLVDDPTPLAACTQRLRIRVGKKTAASPTELPETSMSSSVQGYKGKEKEKAKEVHNRVIMWPAEPEICCSDPTLERLSYLMNPEGHQGNISAADDERSMVYATGGATGSLQVLVWLSFDPAAKLSGKWSGGLLNSPEAPVVGCVNGYARSPNHDDSGGGVTRGGFPGVSHKYPLQVEPSQANTFFLVEGASSWARTERAMYTYLPGQYV